VPLAVIAVIVVVLLAGAGALAMLGGGGGGDDDDAGPTTTPAEETTPTTQPCTNASGRCVYIDSIAVEGDHYVVTYETVGYTALVESPADHHVHFFFDTTTLENASSASRTPGTWDAWGIDSHDLEAIYDIAKVSARGEATQMCAGVADFNHVIETPFQDCVDLPS
jgi:hypothetical protein